MPKKDWKTISSEYVLTNPWYKVRQDKIIRPKGNEGVYNVVETGNSVHLIAITDEDKILFIRIFRYATQLDSLELPAGGLEGDEDVIEAAKRELAEETGMSADEYEYIGWFQEAASKMDGIGKVVIARGLHYGERDDKLEEGIEDVKAYSPTEAMELIAKQELMTSSAVSAAILLAVAKGKLEIS
jgi:8-oxo-dGTP pyrophosphatase MutT (NUDIX family)